MKIDTIKISNIDKLYRLIQESYTKDNWTNTIPGSIFDTICESMSVIFHIDDICPVEFMFLKELSTNVQITSDTIIDTVLENVPENIREVLQSLATEANEFPSIKNDNYTDYQKQALCEALVPSILIKFSAAVEYSGHELAVLLGCHDPESTGSILDEDVLAEEERDVAYARTLPYIKFFINTEQSEDAKEIVSTSKIEMAPWDDVFLKQIEIALLQQMMSRLYDTIALYTRPGDIIERFYIKEDGTSFNAIKSPIHLVNMNNDSTVMRNIEEYKKEITSILDHTKNAVYVTKDMVAEDTIMHISYHGKLYDYYRILSMIPYNWIYYVSIPDARDSYLHYTRLASMLSTKRGLLDALGDDIPRVWEHRYRFTDTYTDMIKHIIMEEDDNISAKNTVMGQLKKIEDSKHKDNTRLTINPIQMLMLIPMNYEVLVAFKIPLLEASCILPQLKETCKDDPVLLEFVDKLLTCAIATRGIVLPS